MLPSPGLLSTLSFPPWASAMLLDHREAEAGAAVDSAGAVGLPEALPDVGQVLLVYAYARVGDGEGEPPAGGVEADADRAALGGVFEGVLHEILHQPGP